MKATLLLATCALALSAVPTSAEDVVVQTPDKLTWGDAPQFGKGVQTAVLSGDPAQTGLFVMRIKFPANAVVPAHVHDQAENVTVISGDFGAGMGEQTDKAKGQRLPPGSFAHMPARMPHFAWANSVTVVQIEGMGPMTIKFLEPTVGSSTPAK